MGVVEREIGALTSFLWVLTRSRLNEKILELAETCDAFFGLSGFLYKGNTVPTTPLYAMKKLVALV